MFLNYCILNIFDYICAQNAQCWARIIKSDMEIQRYNRLKAAIERVQSEACFIFTEREQARPQVKIVLAEKERTGTWLSEQMGHSISTVSRWMTNNVQPMCGKFDLVARLSENSTRLHASSMWI